MDGAADPAEARSRAQVCKTEGNEAFSAGNYKAALGHYTGAITAVRSATPADRVDASGADDELVVTLYSNSAEALLRLHRHA
jgi:hypothetical protein